MKEEMQPGVEKSKTCPQRNKTVSKDIVAVQTFIGITENNRTSNKKSDNRLPEQMLSSTNLNTAYKRLLRNRGIRGVDKMVVESLKDFLITKREVIVSSIERGKYCPYPVRRVEISKENRNTSLVGNSYSSRGLSNKV